MRHNANFMKNQRRKKSIVNKILEASASVLNSYDPARILADENIGVILEGGQSAKKIARQLIKFYRSQGVAVKSPSIRNFIRALEVSIASDPATNLIKVKI